jgi:preprotein translocase subunit SecG
MSTFFLVLHIFTCVVLVFVVLIQSGKEGGIGMMTGGSSQTVFGSSGGANFFTKFTSAMAAVFMITSIALTAAKSGRKASLFEGSATAPSAESKPAAPVAPKEEAQTQDQGKPAAPQQNAAPAQKR